ncbi:AAA domain-containing protein [Chloroflexota bacterium]
MSQLAEELIQSLDEEIDALKNPSGMSRGGNVVKLFNGRFLREISGLNVYLFNLENFLTVLDDSPAEIEISNYRYSAQVVLTQGLEVEIGIERFLGEFITTATLHTNSWYLLELLKKKLSEAHSGSNKADFTLSEALFNGTLSGASSSTQNDISYSLGQEPPNDAQKRAIETSFFHNLSIIWGPPGTGKTKTVAKAVEAHLNAGLSVLLVSHANNAVDEALQDIAEHLEGSSFYQEGKLVRLGKPQEELLKVLESEYPLVLLDKIADRLGETLSQERSLLENEKAQIDNAVSSLSSVILILARVRTLSSELEGVKTSFSQTLHKLEETQASLSQIDDLQERNRKRLLEAQSAGTLKRFLTGLHPDKIQHEIDQTGIRRDSIARTLETNVKLKSTLGSSCKAKENELDETRAEANILLQQIGISEGELEKRRNKCEVRKDTILSRIAEINKELEEIQNKVLSEASLVATTLTKTFTAKQFPGRQFDVLILDEASMAPLPHLYWALGRCCKSITIVGDFLQLPPICISDKPMAQRWLSRSIFDVLGIRSIKEAQNDERVTLLDTQYRMVPAISEISNRFIYQGILRDHSSTSSTSRKILNDGISLSPLVLIETDKMNAWCSRISSGGRFNLYHALVCVTLARKIIQHTPDCRIGIVTPYTHQARLINNIAKDWQITDKVRISTIYRFQGGEQQTIIFDSTEGIGLRTAPMLDDTKINSDALRVLNVAMTRAKDRLYLVANTKRLLGELGSESLLSRIIHHFQQKAEVFGSDSLVDNYFTTDFEKWAEALLVARNADSKPISGELYTERNFWAQFLQDIRNVRQRLMILSPFTSVNRAGIFMDYFKAMIGQGVDIRIYTRPVNQQVSEVASQSEIVVGQLRSIGVNVIERRNMHQKVAILDNDVTWEGSLNILSHRDSGEQMRRFTGESTVDEIIKNLELLEENAIGRQTSEPCPGSDGTACKYNGYLVIRRNRRRGNRFLGCSSYPKCKYTKPLQQSNSVRR